MADSDLDPQYVPSPPPIGIDRITAEWVSRELQRIHEISINKVGMRGMDGAWFDNLAPMTLGRVAAGSPAMATFNTTWEALRFGAGDAVYLYFHINHDIKRNSYVYPHVHWSSSTAVAGDVTWLIDYTVAKGHNQEAFPSTTQISLTQNYDAGVAWQHMITEADDNDAFLAPEVDSVVIMKVEMDSKGAGMGDIFGLFVDMHYQMERTGTLNKAPDFYTR